ncbi:MAG: PHP domain-containing protein [Chloroflexi bacterium]|nr:PHP domain-containing protein [Chloroflexota bacterium]
MARLDLHMHSTCSDGRHPPGWVIRQAASNGAELVALTDHDTLAGVEEARQVGGPLGVTVVAGVEMSVIHDPLGELHVLGYLPARDDLADLELQLSEYRDERLGRARRTLDLLRDLGAPIEEDAVVRHADGGVVGRPHIARALVDAGHVESVQEAFDRYLRNGGPAFVQRSVLGMEESIALIHDCGGIASLAHPTRYRETEASIESFAAAGGDAVELYYRNDPPDVVASGKRLARRLGLAATGGSDFQGIHTDEMPPATVPIPDHSADRLIDLLKDLAI